MKRNPWPLSIAIALVHSAGVLLSADAPLPVIDGKETVASVNGVPITLEAFADALAQAHAGAMESTQAVSPRDPSALLDRLIGVELVIQEAENIGLDELPKIRESVEEYRVRAIRQLLLGQQAERVTTPDAMRVEQLYREQVREVRVASIMVDSEEAAAAALARIEAGEDFDELAREAIVEGTVNPNSPDDYVRFNDLRPAVRTAVSELEPGQVSPVLRVEDSFALVRLIDTRYPENPDVRAEIERAALRQAKESTMRRHVDALREQYTTVDEELFAALDYTSEGPGLEAMRADRRVVAAVRGGEPVTVGELTRALEKRAFHGAERAIALEKFDNRKHPVLEEILKKRAIDLEAARLELAETEEYRAMIERHRKGLLFGAFLERAVDSSIKIADEDLERYLAEHAAEYSTPEMMRLESIAFVQRADAETALAKLNQGADFQWMLANAEGQVGPQDDPDLLRFDGRMPIVTTSLPDDLRRAVAGSRTGDVRFYMPPGGPAYVLAVREVVPSQLRQLDAVREAVAKKVIGERRQAALDEWIAALREASEIEVFGSGDALLQALGMHVGDPE